MNLLGYDINEKDAAKKKEKIPSIVANDWVLDVDAHLYANEDNPDGIGSCAGFSLLVFCFIFIIFVVFAWLVSYFVCLFLQTSYEGAGGRELQRRMGGQKDPTMCVRKVAEGPESRINLRGT